LKAPTLPQKSMSATVAPWEALALILWKARNVESVPSAFS
jgi:hypothetical protein